MSVTVTFEHGLGASVKAKGKMPRGRMGVIGLHIRCNGSIWYECAFRPSGYVSLNEWSADQLEPWTDEHESEVG